MSDRIENATHAHLSNLIEKERLPDSSWISGLPRQAHMAWMADLALRFFGKTHENLTQDKILGRAFPDVHWAESEKKELSVEDIHQLHVWLLKAPYVGKQKLAFIPFADKLNMAASNALLKILEEPPAHGKLLLMTQMSEGLISTLASRCVHFAVHTDATQTIFEDDPEWLGELKQSLYKPADASLSQWLDLAQRIAKDKPAYPRFFHQTQAILLQSAQAHPDLLDVLKNIPSLEDSLMRRYHNAESLLQNFFLEVRRAHNV